MRKRLVALILTSSVALLGACDSGSDSGSADADRPSGSTSSSPSPSDSPTSEPVPALRLKSAFGTSTYCLNAGGDLEDYLWSGTWLAAHEDATISAVTPGALLNMRVVGSWVVEDSRDDGEIAPWSEASPRIKGHLVPLQDARLTGGSAYRVVLRLRPQLPLPSEMDGLVVDFSSEGEGGTVTDPSKLRIASDC